MRIQDSEDGTMKFQSPKGIHVQELGSALPYPQEWDRCNRKSAMSSDREEKGHGHHRDTVVRHFGDSVVKGLEHGLGNRENRVQILGTMGK